MEKVAIISSIILAILTQHLVAWAGSVLWSVASVGINYAVFTF